jgi:hypothetical protein
MASTHPEIAERVVHQPHDVVSLMSDTILNTTQRHLERRLQDDVVDARPVDRSSLAITGRN